MGLRLESNHKEQVEDRIRRWTMVACSLDSANDDRWITDCLASSRYVGETDIAKGRIDPMSLTCLACVLPALRKWRKRLPDAAAMSNDSLVDSLNKKVGGRLNRGALQVIGALKKTWLEPRRGGKKRSSLEDMDSTQMFYAAIVVRECEQILRTEWPSSASASAGPGLPAFVGRDKPAELPSSGGGVSG